MFSRGTIDRLHQFNNMFSVGVIFTLPPKIKTTPFKRLRPLLGQDFVAMELRPWSDLSSRGLGWHLDPTSL